MSGPVNPVVYTAALTAIFSEALPKLEAQRLPCGLVCVSRADMELRASPRSGMVYAMLNGILSHSTLDTGRCDLIAQLAERILLQHKGT